MSTKLLCLHGFSQNGAVLRDHMAEWSARLPSRVVPQFVDAPHGCDPKSVERMFAFIDSARLPPPHLCFWDASDDGRVYRGWEDTRELLRAHVAGAERVGVLGFSQGAIVATALCALAASGEFPALAFAVLIAGRTPRSDLLEPLLAQPIDMPSLHVWGERDGFAKSESPLLVDRFTSARREVCVWAGPHVVPTRGSAADTMLDFVREHG